MTHSNASSANDRQLALVVLKNLALDEIQANERLLTSITELSGAVMNDTAAAVNYRLGQLQLAVRVAEELLDVT